MADPSPTEPPRWVNPPRVQVINVEVRDTDPGVVKGEPLPVAARLLMQMKFRVRQGRPPLPEGFVAPPGVDVEALLKQVPWPPPTA
ncbi:MAG: hypothetical protein K2X87_19465 [Gemmataceae bacterium]|nr:hypothetical protein [Gemmataceae bacterium]